MSIIKKMRKQKAMWWKRSTEANQYGQFTFEPAVEISCRWDGAGKEYRERDGQMVVSESVAYVDRPEITFGDRLKLGPMESDVALDPMEDHEAFEVRRTEQTPNLRATETLYTVYLSLRYA